MPGVPLVVVESPYRTLVGPLLAYLDVLDAAWPPDKAAPITFVVIPEYVARSWWERILYNQSAKRLRSVLLGRPHTVVVAVPYRREDPALFEAALGGERPPDPEQPEPPTVPTAADPPTARTARAATAGGSAAAADRRLTARSPGGIVTGHVRRPRPGLSPSGPRPQRWIERRRIVRLVAEYARQAKAELVAVHVVEIDWTLPLDADIAGRSEEVQRVLDMAESVAEDYKIVLEPVLLQARDVGAAIVDEATERGADLLVVGLPYRKRFGGEFAIGRTIPYILQNAPCAVWVVRDPMNEEPA